jgi:fatty acid desaturase
MTLFKHPEDRWPVAVILMISLLDGAIYYTVEHWALLVGYWLLLIVPKGIVSAWNHHHQHSMTFRSPALNRLLELAFTFQTGMSTNLWVLHHVLGHHRNFLDQKLDESRWRRGNGQQMGMLEYTVTVAATSYYRAFQVGKRFRGHQRTFLLWTGIALALLGVLVYLKPLQGLLVFALPMVSSLLFTSWVTYDHHAGLATEQELGASYNILNPLFNTLTGNLGFHTAHHHRQGVHWSKLPALHAEIEAQIPAHCYRSTTFELFLPTPKQHDAPVATPAATTLALPLSAAAVGEAAAHPAQGWQTASEV